MWSSEWRASGKGAKAAWTIMIVLIAASAGILVDWRAPGIDRYSRDWLMRARGPLPAPDDIAIVAIDETSIARFGRFPWPRSVIARAIDALAAAQPKVIALDVLFTDPSTPEQDNALAAAIVRAGNVVAAAQLTDPPMPGGPATWLLPLPAIAKAAAAVGHVNVLTESEGVARQIQVRAADDAGRSFRAMALETVRVADGTSDLAVVDGRGELRLGNRVIPVERWAPPVLTERTQGAAELLAAGRMSVDYIGPSGSFAPKTYRIADVLDGRVLAARFSGRYVLIGATAASLGDRLASPFQHQTDPGGNQHGSPTPGVEVLANAVNTILRSRFYSETPDGLRFVIAALVAAATLAGLGMAQGRREALNQTAVLAGLGAAVVLAGHLAFDHLLVFPPLVPSVVSFASAGVLGLLWRSLAASAALDAGLAALDHAGGELAPAWRPDTAAESIARLTGASGVAILSESTPGSYRRIAAYGVGFLRRPDGSFIVPGEVPGNHAVRTWPLEDRGLLVLANLPDRPASDRSVAVARAIAAAAIATGRGPAETLPVRWPRGLEAKAQHLGWLNARMVERGRFVDCAMRSVGDGLIVAGPDASITFANPAAARLLETTVAALIGRNLLDRIDEGDPPGHSGMLDRLLIDRTVVEREVTIHATRSRQCLLRLAAVSSGEHGKGPVLGLVASLADVTRLHELHQTKNDVISLVSHEMRTPLAAIQGMTELLANYELDPDRRREMSQAINDEAKRLTRMITEYLDITRLEAGATTLRPAPVRVDTLLDRVLLLLEPVAAARRMHLVKGVVVGLAPIVADADLLARAVSNLVSNAIKYSPEGRPVTVSARTDRGSVVIEVADEGYGIPAELLDRVFQKFYRVPRVQDADTPGTGLGLALVREIAELHGGSVGVTSEPGVGSVFALRIPVDSPVSH
jgi:signal transduction histidine kinase/CHASE2 domain-containing sensor protein